MGKRDPRVDAYIKESAAFARPILTRLRDVVHEVCPEVRETMKWSMPYFDYEGPLCGMSAFKEHCAFGFWKGSLIVEKPSTEAMGQLGRIRSVEDLPPKKTLTGWIRKGMSLNQQGVKAPRASQPKKREVRLPADLPTALGRNAKARLAFAAFSPSHRREYVEWIEEAKRPETREKRVATTIEWLAEGRPRNWKYL